MDCAVCCNRNDVSNTVPTDLEQAEERQRGELRKALAEEEAQRQREEEEQLARKLRERDEAARQGEEADSEDKEAWLSETTEHTKLEAETEADGTTSGLADGNLVAMYDSAPLGATSSVSWTSAQTLVEEIDFEEEVVKLLRRKVDWSSSTPGNPVSSHSKRALSLPNPGTVRNEKRRLVMLPRKRDLTETDVPTSRDDLQRLRKRIKDHLKRQTCVKNQDHESTVVKASSANTRTPDELEIQRHGLWGTTCKDLGNYGVGVQLYFEMQLFVGLLFTVLFVVSLPMLWFCASGNNIFQDPATQAEADLLKQLARMSMGNLGYFEERLDVYRNITALRSRQISKDNPTMLAEVIPFLGMIDGITVLMTFCFAAFFAFWWIPHTVATQDQCNVTAEDFAVEVTGLPKFLETDGNIDLQRHESEYAYLLEEHFNTLLKRIGCRSTVARRLKRQSSSKVRTSEREIDLTTVPKGALVCSKEPATRSGHEGQERIWLRLNAETEFLSREAERLSLLGDIRVVGWKVEVDEDWKDALADFEDLRRVVSAQERTLHISVGVEAEVGDVEIEIEQSDGEKLYWFRENEDLYIRNVNRGAMKAWNDTAAASGNHHLIIQHRDKIVRVHDDTDLEKMVTRLEQNGLLYISLEVELFEPEISFIRVYKGQITDFLWIGSLLKQCRNEQELANLAKFEGEEAEYARHMNEAIELATKATKVDVGVQGMKPDAERGVRAAIIVFKREDAKTEVLWAYHRSRANWVYRLFGPIFQRPHLRFFPDGRQHGRKNYKLTVQQACDPSDFFWDHLDHRPWKRFVRQVIISSFSVIFLLLTCASLVFLKANQTSAVQPAKLPVFIIVDFDDCLDSHCQINFIRTSDPSSCSRQVADLLTLPEKMEFLKIEDAYGGCGEDACIGPACGSLTVPDWGRSQMHGKEAMQLALDKPCTQDYAMSSSLTDRCCGTGQKTKTPLKAPPTSQACSAPLGDVPAGHWVAFKLQTDEQAVSCLYINPAQDSKAHTHQCRANAGKLKLYACLEMPSINISSAMKGDLKKDFLDTNCWELKDIALDLARNDGYIRQISWPATVQRCDLDKVVGYNIPNRTKDIENMVDAGYVCYCSKMLHDRGSGFLRFDKNDRDKQLCKDFTQNVQNGYVRLILGIVGVSTINILLPYIFHFLDWYCYHRTNTDFTAHQSYKLFLMQFANTGLLYTMVNANLHLDRDNLFARFQIGTGSFDEITPQWFANTGSNILITVVTLIFSTTLTPLILYPILKWSENMWNNCRCCGRRLQAEAVTSEMHLENYWPHPWTFDLRVAQSMNLYFCVYIYAGVMPLLYPVGALYCLASYWTDKIFLLRFADKPPAYRAESILNVAYWLPIAAVLHTGFSMWAFSEQRLAPSRNNQAARKYWASRWQISNTQYDDIQVARDSDRENWPTHYVRARLLDLLAREGSVFLASIASVCVVLCTLMIIWTLLVKPIFHMMHMDTLDIVSWKLYRSVLWMKMDRRERSSVVSANVSANNKVKSGVEGRCVSRIGNLSSAINMIPSSAGNQSARSPSAHLPAFDEGGEREDAKNNEQVLSPSFRSAPSSCSLWETPPPPPPSGLTVETWDEFKALKISQNEMCAVSYELQHNPMYARAYDAMRFRVLWHAASPCGTDLEAASHQVP